MAFHLPKKFSQVAQIIFFFYEKSSKRTNESQAMQRSGQNMENIFLLIRMAQEKQRRKTSRENTG